MEGINIPSIKSVISTNIEEPLIGKIEEVSEKTGGVIGDTGVSTMQHMGIGKMVMKACLQADHSIKTTTKVYINIYIYIYTIYEKYRKERLQNLRGRRVETVF